MTVLESLPGYTTGFMTRIRRLSLFLVVLFFSLPLFCQQQDCPIQLQQVNLTSRSNLPPLWGIDNVEMDLLVRYKSSSAKAISSARILVETTLLLNGPAHSIVQRKRQSFFLIKALKPRQHADAKFEVFSSDIAPRAWLTDVSFADGSSWSSNDPSNPSSCAYPRSRRRANVAGLILLPVPSKD